MQLSIISLNYNRSHLTTACMASLWKHYKNEFESGEFEYIVVDNLSEDDSLHILQQEAKKYKNFYVLANDSNAGFGAGNNFGAKKAKGKYVLFLNNDTLVEDRGLVKMLAYFEQHEEIGALGGKILNFDGTQQPATGRFYSLITLTLFILGLEDMGFVNKNPTTIQNVDWLKGALLMMKKEVFEKIGRFDERIWMYTEDIEICYRVHESGLACVFFPDITIRHKDQGSTNRTFAIVNIYKNLPYFYKKHKSALEYQYVKFLLRAKGLVLMNVGKLLHNTYLAETYSEAYKAIK